MYFAKTEKEGVSYIGISNNTSSSLKNETLVRRAGFLDPLNRIYFLRKKLTVEKNDILFAPAVPERLEIYFEVLVRNREEYNQKPFLFSTRKAEFIEAPRVGERIFLFDKPKNITKWKDLKKELEKENRGEGEENQFYPSIIIKVREVLPVDVFLQREESSETQMKKSGRLISSRGNISSNRLIVGGTVTFAGKTELILKLLKEIQEKQVFKKKQSFFFSGKS